MGKKGKGNNRRPQSNNKNQAGQTIPAPVNQAVTQKQANSKPKRKTSWGYIILILLGLSLIAEGLYSLLTQSAVTVGEAKEIEFRTNVVLEYDSAEIKVFHVGEKTYLADEYLIFGTYEKDSVKKDTLKLDSQDAANLKNFIKTQDDDEILHSFSAKENEKEQKDEAGNIKHLICTSEKERNILSLVVNRSGDETSGKVKIDSVKSKNFVAIEGELLAITSFKSDDKDRPLITLGDILFFPEFGVEDKHILSTSVPELPLEDCYLLNDTLMDVKIGTTNKPIFIMSDSIEIAKIENPDGTKSYERIVLPKAIEAGSEQFRFASQGHVSKIVEIRKAELIKGTSISKLSKSNDNNGWFFLMGGVVLIVISIVLYFFLYKYKGKDRKVAKLKNEIKELEDEINQLEQTIKEETPSGEVNEEDKPKSKEDRANWIDENILKQDFYSEDKEVKALRQNKESMGEAYAKQFEEGDYFDYFWNLKYKQKSPKNSELEEKKKKLEELKEELRKYEPIESNTETGESEPPVSQTEEPKNTKSTPAPTTENTQKDPEPEEKQPEEKQPEEKEPEEKEPENTGKSEVENLKAQIKSYKENVKELQDKNRELEIENAGLKNDNKALQNYKESAEEKISNAKEKAEADVKKAKSAAQAEIKAEKEKAQKKIDKAEKDAKETEEKVTKKFEKQIGDLQSDIIRQKNEIAGLKTDLKDTKGILRDTTDKLEKSTKENERKDAALKRYSERITDVAPAKAYAEKIEKLLTIGNAVEKATAELAAKADDRYLIDKYMARFNMSVTAIDMMTLITDVFNISTAQFVYNSRMLATFDQNKATFTNEVKMYFFEKYLKQYVDALVVLNETMIGMKHLTEGVGAKDVAVFEKLRNEIAATLSSLEIEVQNVRIWESCADNLNLSVKPIELDYDCPKNTICQMDNAIVYLKGGAKPNVKINVIVQS